MNLLPHESVLLQARLTVAQAEVAYYGQKMGEAAGPSSDWHDNPAYEQALRDHGRANNTLDGVQSAVDLVANAALVDYPPETSRSIRLGSLFLADYSHQVVIPTLIVGQRKIGADADWYKRLWESSPQASMEGEYDPDEGLEVTSPGFPLGDKVMGVSPGDHVTYSFRHEKDPRNRSLRVVRLTVGMLDQTWLMERLLGVTELDFVKSFAEHVEEGVRDSLFPSQS